MLNPSWCRYASLCHSLKWENWLRASRKLLTAAWLCTNKSMNKTPGKGCPINLTQVVERSSSPAKQALFSCAMMVWGISIKTFLCCWNCSKILFSLILVRKMWSEEEGEQQHQNWCLQIKSIGHFDGGEPKTMSPRQSCCGESPSEWFSYSVFTQSNVLIKMSAQVSFASNCPKRALEKDMWHWGTWLVCVVMVEPTLTILWL